MKILSITTEIESSVENIEITFTDNNGKKFTAEFTRRNNIKPLPLLFQSEDPYAHITLDNQIELIDAGYDTTEEEETKLWDLAKDYTPPASEDNDSKTHAAIMGIDWKMLRWQKEVLFEFSKMEGNFNITELENSCEGILSLLDSLQDAVVEDGLFKEEEVFAAETVADIEPVLR